MRNIRPNSTYAQPPHLFLNQGSGRFRDVARELGPEFARPKVGRGLACGDFDNNGSVDLLVATNGGPALLYRNDVTSANRFLRLSLRGTKSNRDGIGAVIRLSTADSTQTRTVKSGSSYLSQSELAVTFGLGGHDKVRQIIVYWPSGRTQEFSQIAHGKYRLAEGSLIEASGV